MEGQPHSPSHSSCCQLPRQTVHCRELPLQKISTLHISYPSFVANRQDQQAKMSDLFNPIGEKVGKVAPVVATNGTNEAAHEAEDDGKVVEEVESLCMNCHENVSRKEAMRRCHELPLIAVSYRE